MAFTPPDLTGKVAVVTGASRGIGKAIALALAENGADVTVAAKSVRSHDRLPGSIHETAAAIEALGRRALPIQTDVRDIDQVQAMVDGTVAELGRLDILVNNAGALYWKSVADTPMKRFDLLHQVNVRAAFAAFHFALPHMIRQGGGHLINIAPPVERQLLPGKVAYMLSKFAMSMMAEGLAQEVRQHNVAVNALWPATIVESQASINHGLSRPEHWRKATVVSDALLAMLSHDASTLTGEILTDEEMLKRAGVTDFSPYLCVEGGEPIYITGPNATWDLGATGLSAAKPDRPE